jgi:hypothetical protein
LSTQGSVSKMPYTIEVFQSWPSTYSSWEALRDWLTSPEGGSLRVVEPKGSPYAVVRTVNGQSNFDLPHVRWCRSVVVDKATRLVRSVAPPKAQEDFFDASQPAAVVADNLEEFVEGTMVNVFRDISQGVSLSTRSRVGAGGRFSATGPTFEDMFSEALGSTPREKLLPQFLASAGHVAVFASTVLAHPANRIVCPVLEPGVTLIHQGIVDSDGGVTIEEHPVVEGVNVPQVLVLGGQAFGNVLNTLHSISRMRGQFWQGAVCRSRSFSFGGTRYRWMNPSYEVLKKLRGNEGKPEERFARLRRARSVTQYLSIFEGDRQVMYELEGSLRRNTRQLFRFYCDTWKAHTTPFHRLPWPYKHHVSVLHNQFKNVLFPAGKKVDLESVVQYVNGLSLDDLANMAKEHTVELRPATEVSPATAATDAPAAPAAPDATTSASASATA